MMKIVAPPKPIHSSEIVNEDLIVTIPVKKRWFEILWLTLGLFFTAPFVFLFGSLITALVLLGSAGQLGDTSSFDLRNITFFSCAMGLMLFPPAVLAPLMIIYSLLWRFAGVEIVSVNKDVLVITRKIFGWKSHKAYKSSEISAMSISRPTDRWTPISSELRNLLGFSGTIALDYGAKTFRFGNQLDEAEGRQIIREIQTHLSRSLPPFEVW